jgi:hypothetical protein
MKKRTIFAALCSLVLATPVFACPNMDHEAAPRTAEKDKKAPEQKEAPKAEAPKADTKQADTAKKDTKKPDKVSQK